MQSSCRVLPQLVLNNAIKHPTKNLLYRKDHGRYRPVSASGIQRAVSRVCLALLQRGFAHQDRACILSTNRPEWVHADMGIMLAGGISTPIYPTSSPSEVAFILQNSGAKFLFVEDDLQYQKVLDVLPDCPGLEHIIVFSPSDRPKDTNHSSFESFTHDLQKPDLSIAYFEQRLTACKPDDIATIVYTSGTTGTPKGVMLTHQNILSNVNGALDAVDLTEDEVVLSFLPLSHVFERTAGYYTLMALGGRIYYAESIDTVSDNLIEMKPTAVVSVPRFYEKIHARILSQLSGVKKIIFYWAMGVAKKMRPFETVSEAPSKLQFQHRLADTLVFSKIRAKTGGRLRFFVSGGAPLNPDIAQFFKDLGLLILEGYGMTESSPIIACNRITQHRFGTAGLPLQDVEVTCDTDGELLTRGPHVMKGYWNNPEETAKVIDSDGWLRTGDMAKIDSDGFVHIIDRKKELIVLSTGKNVAPMPLEAKLIANRFIAQSLIIGDHRKYLSLLIVPDFDALHAVGFGHLASTPDKVILDAKLHKFYHDIACTTLADFSAYKQPKAITILSREFSQEADELTPTLKPKRRVIHAHYHAEIEAMYNERTAS